VPDVPSCHLCGLTRKLGVFRFWNKVGAALSMVYRSKVPVVFVGTGQKYTNLKRLNVDSVIEALFK